MHAISIEIYFNIIPHIPGSLTNINIYVYFWPTYAGCRSVALFCAFFPFSTARNYPPVTGVQSIIFKNWAFILCVCVCLYSAYIYALALYIVDTNPRADQICNTKKHLLFIFVCGTFHALFSLNFSATFLGNDNAHICTYVYAKSMQTTLSNDIFNAVVSFAIARNSNFVRSFKILFQSIQSPWHKNTLHMNECIKKNVCILLHLLSFCLYARKEKRRRMQTLAQEIHQKYSILWTVFMWKATNYGTANRKSKHEVTNCQKKHKF